MLIYFLQTFIDKALPVLDKMLTSKMWKLSKGFLSKGYQFIFRHFGMYYFGYIRWRYIFIVKRLKKQDKIKVAFFVIHDSIWKVESIYKLMEKDNKFLPVIIVCPYTDYDVDTMKVNCSKTYSALADKGYKVVTSFNEQTKKWLDVKKEVQPDIVFFSSPWQLTKNEYCIANYLHCLTYYVPYGFCIANQQDTQFNQLFHNLVWTSFYETPIHKKMAIKYAVNKGKNVAVYGYPMCDVFLDKGYVPKNPWKSKDEKVKRIIWAPHHSIEDNPKQMRYSNFLILYQFIFNLIKKYDGKIQLAFKPHPILKPKLYLHPDWGKQRTDAYYRTWQNVEYGQLEEGSYEDLFLTSDALLLDSISFMAEYLYTHKPALFVLRDDTIKTNFNEFGSMALELMYQATNENEILDFIDQTVLNNHDPLLEKKEGFVKTNLTPTNNCTASALILQHIKNEICNEIYI